MMLVRDRAGPTATAGRKPARPIYILTLWVVAAATMFTGNVLAILQTVRQADARVLVDRALGVHARGHHRRAWPWAGTFWDNGLAAVLFYLLCYGVMNVGAFAVLASSSANA
jgi:hypothetical protein